MNTIACWDDLRPYGIIPLTGEACGLGYRLLCDVTARGNALLERVFDVPSIDLAENWNRGTDAAPHIGSIMLSPDMLTPLAIFALLESGAPEVWTTKSSGVLGIEPSDAADEAGAALPWRAHDLLRRFRYGGTAGDRNVHAMSGRIR